MTSCPKCGGTLITSRFFEGKLYHSQWDKTRSCSAYVAADSVEQEEDLPLDSERQRE